MSLDNPSGISGYATESGISDENSHVFEKEEVSVVIETEQGSVHPAFLPTLLLKSRERIRGATRQALEDGRSLITARTSRERLIAALQDIRGVKLAEI